MRDGGMFMQNVEKIDGRRDVTAASRVWQQTLRRHRTSQRLRISRWPQQTDWRIHRHSARHVGASRRQNQARLWTRYQGDQVSPCDSTACGGGRCLIRVEVADIVCVSAEKCIWLFIARCAVCNSHVAGDLDIQELLRQQKATKAKRKRLRRKLRDFEKEVCCSNSFCISLRLHHVVNAVNSFLTMRSSPSRNIKTSACITGRRWHDPVQGSIAQPRCWLTIVLLSSRSSTCGASFPPTASSWQPSTRNIVTWKGSRAFWTPWSRSTAWTRAIEPGCSASVNAAKSAEKRSGGFAIASATKPPTHVTSRRR